VRLSVSDERARGCEVLLEDHGAPVVEVAFESGVKGTQVREAPRTAVVFIAEQDAPIAAGAVEVRFADEGKGAPSIEVVHCTDADGAPLSEAKVEIQG